MSLELRRAENRKHALPLLSSVNSWTKLAEPAVFNKFGGPNVMGLPSTATAFRVASAATCFSDILVRLKAKLLARLVAAGGYGMTNRRPQNLL